MDNIPTEPGQSYASVQWQLPVSSDNSNEPLTLTGLRPPQKLNVGKRHITYTVTDSSGLSRGCVFVIHIKGTHCISNCSIKSLLSCRTIISSVWRHYAWVRPQVSLLGWFVLFAIKNYSSRDLWLLMKTSHLVQMNFSSCHGHWVPHGVQTHALRLLQKFLRTHGLISMVSKRRDT